MTPGWSFVAMSWHHLIICLVRDFQPWLQFSSYSKGGDFLLSLPQWWEAIWVLTSPFPPSPFLLQSPQVSFISVLLSNFKISSTVPVDNLLVYVIKLAIQYWAEENHSDVLLNRGEQCLWVTMMTHWIGSGQPLWQSQVTQLGCKCPNHTGWWRAVNVQN